jgi:hypothetical protein
MRPWPLSIACTLARNKKIHKKTKRMAAVRERSKLEKEGFDKKKPGQSKTTEGGGKKQGRRRTMLKKTRR